VRKKTLHGPAGTLSTPFGGVVLKSYHFRKKRMPEHETSENRPKQGKICVKPWKKQSVK